MTSTFPGTTVEVSKLQKGSSKILFDGIFATGGITLSQVSVMTGLEPYLIQNWVKRGFVASPKKRVYSREQFARVVIINMLRETLQIERVCKLIKIVGGALDDPDDDLIGDDELYHKYVDMLASSQFDMTDKETVRRAAEDALVDFEDSLPDKRKQLVRILQVMLYAHVASELRRSAEEMLAALE